MTRWPLRLPSCLCALALLGAAAPSRAEPPARPGRAALSPALLQKVHAAVDADAGRLTALFLDLHQHPELAFAEKRTAGVVARNLKALGFDVTEGVGVTGVVGVLANGPGPTLWFRADLDSNAIREATGLPYAATVKHRRTDGSQVDVMHACGHDAHLTWLLGLAKAMVALRAEWSGTLVLYAQPGEESGLGARTLVEDQLWYRAFPRPDYALAAHTTPAPVGYVLSAPGVRMAGSDQLEVTFRGVGGHGAAPQATIDPVVMAAQAVLAYQTIISRNLDPQVQAVLSVGSISAGHDANVIPDTAVLKLNLRWFDPAVRERLLRRIDEVNAGVALSAGMPADRLPVRTMKGGAGPLVNDPSLVAQLNPSLALLVGAGQLVDQYPPVMGSEDFQEAFGSLGTPYAYLLVGVAPRALYDRARAEGRPFPYANHSPDFFVDLAAIPVGAKIDVVAALGVLAKRD